MTYSEEIKGLCDFLQGQILSINKKSTSIERIFKSVLVAILIDLKMAFLLISGDVRVPTGNDEIAFEEYINHIKRSFILDTWRVIETQTRIIAKQMNIEVKSKSTKISECIEQAENYLNQIDDSSLNNLKNAKKCLKTIKNDVKNDDFIEFPKIRDALFTKMYNGDKEKIKNEIAFLEILSTMRNTSHSGFIANKSKGLNSKFISKSFVEGEGIKLNFSEIKKIVLSSIEFLKQLEIYKASHESSCKSM